MDSYRIVVPPERASMIDESVPERISLHLVANGVAVEGVTIETVAEADDQDGVRRRFSGLFLRIESDRDPMQFLSTFQWQRPKSSGKQSIESFIDKVERGVVPNPAEMRAVVYALAKYLDQRID